MKHEIDNSALNDAGWKFVEEYEKRVASQCPPLLFNHVKGILEPVIQFYLLKSGLAAPTKPTFKIGQRFKLGGHEFMLVQSEPWKVCLVNLKDGNRFYDTQLISNPLAITHEEMELITVGSKYEVI
jgi:hypothetical protein